MLFSVHGECGGMHAIGFSCSSNRVRGGVAWQREPCGSEKSIEIAGIHALDRRVGPTVCQIVPHQFPVAYTVMYKLYIKFAVTRQVLVTFRAGARIRREGGDVVRVAGGQYGFPRVLPPGLTCPNVSGDRRCGAWSGSKAQIQHRRTPVTALDSTAMTCSPCRGLV